jgi:hypothetical protein
MRRSYQKCRAAAKSGSIRLDKTQDEHNESALPPKLTVAADIRDRQFSANNGHAQKAKQESSRL